MIQIISIGDELLCGEILNSNFQYIARMLSDEGYRVNDEHCIADKKNSLNKQFTDSLANYQLIITTGGLGPTKDDITKATMADCCGLELSLDEALSDRIKAKYVNRAKDFTVSSWEKQALVPQGAAYLENEWGTAPGIAIERGDQLIIMLPGPPRECWPMFEQCAMPLIRNLLKPDSLTRSIGIYGIPESIIEKRTEKILNGHSDIDIAYCLKADSCNVRLSSDLNNHQILAKAEQALYEEFGTAAQPADKTLVELLCDQLRQRQWVFGTAESCTGGGIGSYVTELAGVSDVFEGGVITYSNRLKMELLGVSEESLNNYGAVSEQVAGEMVNGLCERYSLDAGIAVTGIAGPGGGTSEKPVGTVYIAVKLIDHVEIIHAVYAFDRRGMRERTRRKALLSLWEMLKNQKHTNKY